MNQFCRRTFLASLGAAAALTSSTGALAGSTWLSDEVSDLSTEPRKRLLFFTKSAGFQHDVVKRDQGALAYAERIMMGLGEKYGFDVVCSKDGTVFESDYQNFDAYFFYTTEDLINPGTDKEPGISLQGKQNLLDAVRAGKGFGGSHCASDTYHSPGDRTKASAEIDPYIQMIGGEFIRHGRQQEARMRVVDPKFPGLEAAGEGFTLNEEWYSLKNFNPDLHVILVQETKGMKDADYDRPPYPATWARKHGEGRVFYTSMGHREDVWVNPLFESILVGGLKWIMGMVEAEVPTNIDSVTPEASKLPKL